MLYFNCVKTEHGDHLFFTLFFLHLVFLVFLCFRKNKEEKTNLSGGLNLFSVSPFFMFYSLFMFYYIFCLFYIIKKKHKNVHVFIIPLSKA